MDYDLLKLIHIVSSTVLFGTSIGSAFFLFSANRRKDVAGIYYASRNVVTADWLFTLPAAIIQLATGLWLKKEANFPLDEDWICLALMLYGFAVLCWVPVMCLQVKMRNMAKVALDSGEPLPARYWKLGRWWNLLGTLIFPAILAVFYLMVFKP